MASFVEGANNDFQKPPFFSRISATASRYFQKLLDDVNPYVSGRWAFSCVLMLFYIFRIWFLGGWYIITYALAIYILNLLIGFLSPQVDPEREPSLLPTHKDDEFRPFVRRLPEFKFWYATTRALIIALLCTFIGILNIPVFWPILLIYFIVLFMITMKKQIIHMWTHKYLPFTSGKPKFKGEKAKEEEK